MQFKTELHAHTSEVSPCGYVTAPEVADRFISEGYSSLVITNHYSQYIIDNLNGYMIGKGLGHFAAKKLSSNIFSHS